MFQKNLAQAPTSYPTPIHFVVLVEHKYWSLYSLEEHVSAKSRCLLTIACSKDFKAGSSFLEFCLIELPWALQSSCHTNHQITIHEIDLESSTVQRLSAFNMNRISWKSWSYEENIPGSIEVWTPSAGSFQEDLQMLVLTSANICKGLMRRQPVYPRDWRQKCIF